MNKMINNLLDADDADNADLKGCAIKKDPRHPRYPRLKNNILNGANHLSLNPNHLYSFLILFSPVSVGSFPTLPL